jgi:hypothetical protein
MVYCVEFNSRSVKSIFRNYIWKIVFVVAVVVYVLIDADRVCDMNIFLSAATDILDQKNIYTTVYQTWLYYYYSPIFAVLLIPFTYLSEYWVNVFWLLLNVGLVFRVGQLLKGYLPESTVPAKWQRLILILSIVFVFRFIFDNLHFHQLTIFILWISLEGLYSIKKGNKIKGGLLLAIGINIKLLPLVLIPYLLYRGEFRSFISIVMCSVVLLYLPVIFLGYEYNQLLLDGWWGNINPLEQQHILDFAHAGIPALITAIFHLDVLQQSPLFLNQLNEEEIGWIINTLRVVLIGFTFFFLRTRPFKRTSNLHQLWELGYLFLVIPLIFPHQQNYSLLMLWPAVIYLVYYFYQKHGTYRARDKRLLVVFALCFLAFNAGLYLGHFREFYNGIKLVTIANLLFIIPYSLCTPLELAERRNPSDVHSGN